MYNSVSFSVATWKLATEKPVSLEPRANDGAEEPELWELGAALELELPLETVPEMHFWV